MTCPSDNSETPRWKGNIVTAQANIPDLKISVFGGFHVTAPCGQAVRLSGQKDRALLGFLAVSPGVSHAREKLASMLWSDSGDRQARDSLKQALLRLRRCLGPLADGPLITDRQSVTLDAERVWVDAQDFEALLRDRDPEAIERAAALYNGDLLDGLLVRDASFEDWLQVERQRLRSLAAEALTDLMERALEDGRRDQAVGAARRLLSLDPLHEAACRVLMRVHAERGERSQALKLFETLRRRLRLELDVAPEPETVDLYRTVRCGRSAGPAAPETDGGHAVGAPVADWMVKPSIAVLPFSVMGEDAEQDYFADGLSEDIITDLAQVSALTVAPRHSAFQYKGKPVDIRQAAAELNVGCVLEGRVRAAGGRVRISTQLVDGATGGHIWSARYDRALDDIFALQDEIARTIVDVLKVKLLPEELAWINSPPTTDVDAYQYYLMGRSFYLRGMDKHSLTIARNMFTKATEIDPNYARAFAALASCESYLSISDATVTYEDCVRNSIRALELDPNLAESQAARGLALYSAGRYDEAQPYFERAVSLGPEQFETHFLFARNCRQQGRHEQAAALFERATALRPKDYRTLGLLAWEYNRLGRHGDFEATARAALDRIETAIEEHPDNADALAFGGTLLARLGDLDRAEAWADRAVMIASAPSIAHYNLSIIFGFLGRPDEAMDWLEHAFDSAPEWQRRLIRWMERDADIDQFRDLPRFKALMDRLQPLLAPRLLAASL